MWEDSSINRIIKHVFTDHPDDDKLVGRALRYLAMNSCDFSDFSTVLDSLTRGGRLNLSEPADVLYIAMINAIQTDMIPEVQQRYLNDAIETLLRSEYMCNFETSVVVNGVTHVIPYFKTIPAQMNQLPLCKIYANNEEGPRKLLDSLSPVEAINEKKNINKHEDPAGPEPDLEQFCTDPANYTIMQSYESAAIKYLIYYCYNELLPDKLRYNEMLIDEFDNAQSRMFEKDMRTQNYNNFIEDVQIILYNMNLFFQVVFTSWGSGVTIDVALPVNKIAIIFVPVSQTITRVGPNGRADPQLSNLERLKQKILKEVDEINTIHIFESEWSRSTKTKKSNIDFLKTEIDRLR